MEPPPPSTPPPSTRPPPPPPPDSPSGTPDGTILPPDTVPPKPSTPSLSTPSLTPPVDTRFERTESLLSKSRKLRVLLLSSDTGGGHRASAESLRAALHTLYPNHVQVKIVDFWVDLAEGPFAQFPSQYAFLAKNPLLWKMTYEVTRCPPGRALSECVFNVFAHRQIKQSFETLQPDLIISVHPLVNTLSMNVLQEMEKYTGIPHVPYVTVVTDLGGAHPTWFHRKVDMTYIPSDGVREVGERVGLRREEMRLLGLPVRQDFWGETGEKDAMKQVLGLPVGVPAVLAIGGGDGVGGLQSVVETLATVLTERLGGKNVQIVAICGRNEKLRKWISARTWACPVFAQGFVNNMSDWMTACDVICTKAGPGTIAEALIRGLPMIITSFLPGQEEANVRFVVDHGVGTFAKKPDTIARTAAEWFEQPELLQERSRKCLAIARPNASLSIAGDIVRVTVNKIEENLETMKRRQAARTALSRNDLARYVPNAATIVSSSKESHLVFRLKFMMRVLVGGMLAHEALARDADNN